jgi:hypothetical protein
VNLTIANSNRTALYSACLLCVLVFVLSYSAKLSLYHSQSNTQANPVSSAKVWLSDQKMELQPDNSFVPALWVISVLLSVLVALPERPVKPDQTSIPIHSSLLHLQRFLRPPPVVIE